MKLSRPSRFVAALITLFSLLFAQLAVAAYACPDLQSPPAYVQAEHADMPDCPGGMDLRKPALCKAHCDGPHQAVDAPSAPHPGPFVAATLTCVLPDLALAAPVAAGGHVSITLQYATAPPIAIRNCCFRI